MPTNLTYDLYIGEKDVTFSDFALRCALATKMLGAEGLEPEQEIPETFEPNYMTSDGDARELLAEAKKQLEEAEGWDEEAAENASQEHYDGLTKYREDFRAAQKQLKERYKSMLTQVNEWDAPDTEEIKELRDLMASQLKTCMEHDCRDPWGGKATKKLAGADFKRHHIEIAKERIEKLEALVEKAETTAAKQAAFVKDLKGSLA